MAALTNLESNVAEVLGLPMADAGEDPFEEQ